MKPHSQRLQTLDEIRALLAGSVPLDFQVPSRDEAYQWLENTLCQLGYLRPGKADKGLVRDYLIKVSGFSRAQLTHLISQFRHTGRIRDHRGTPTNAFALNVPTLYLNFHRSCFFPEEAIDAKGHCRKRYPYANLMTPYDKLKSLPEAHHYLKPGITFQQLDDIAMQCSDNEVARRLNQARDKLFRTINKSRQPAA